MAEPDDLETRRRALREALREHETDEDAQRRQKQGSSFAGYAAAFRLSTEFVSAVAVGGVLGYALDWALGTLPLFLILLLLLGFAAGVLNVLRSAGLIRTPQVGKRRPD